MKTKISATTFSANHRKGGRNGPCQPPRNSVTATEQAVIMAAYSPRKKNAHFMLLYSVWKPATSSASASGRSNGARFVSATAVITKRMNASGPNGSTATFHRCACWRTISTIESEPESIRMLITERPIESS